MGLTQEDALWDFACALYERPQVKTILLRWQHRDESNVNMVLFCIWLGINGWRKPALGQMQAFMDEVAVWHDHIVCGLRAMRQLASRHESELAQVLLVDELHAERIEQGLLLRRAKHFRRVRPGSPRQQLQRACQHLKAYFEAQGLRITRRHFEETVTVLHAYFDVLPIESVQSLCLETWRALDGRDRPRQMALSLSSKKALRY